MPWRGHLAECGIDLAGRARLEQYHPQTEDAGALKGLFRLVHAFLIGRVYQEPSGCRRGCQFVQQPEPLGGQFRVEPGDPGEVAARPIETGDEAGRNRVAAEIEDGRNRLCRGLDCARRREPARRGDDRDPTLDQFLGQ